MTRHAELAARAEAHLKTAEASAGDPLVAAQCALAAAILAARPPSLRAIAPLDVEQFLADTADDTTPATVAARAVATAMAAAAARLDDIDVDDGGFPSP